MTEVRRAAFDEAFDLGLDWQPIAPAARAVWMLATVIGSSPFLLVFIAVCSVGAGVAGLLIGLVVSAALLALAWWLIDRRYRSWGYCVHDDELALRRGRVVRRLTIVPVGRMQFIDIQQGPLDRWLGVANLQLHTAAAASDAKVPMLELDVAGHLRDELTRRGAGRDSGT